jgi:hypothetical protein
MHGTMNKIFPQILVFTFCNRLNVHKFCVPPTHCIYVVLYGSQDKKRLFSYLHGVDWLVYITETESVYCAVRAKHLNTV